MCCTVNAKACTISTAGLHLNSFIVLHWTFITFQAILLGLQGFLLYCQKYHLELVNSNVGSETFTVLEVDKIVSSYQP
jgi:hypothetical protein